MVFLRPNAQTPHGGVADLGTGRGNIQPEEYCTEAVDDPGGSSRAGDKKARSASCYILLLRTSRLAQLWRAHAALMHKHPRRSRSRSGVLGGTFICQHPRLSPPTWSGNCW